MTVQIIKIDRSTIKENPDAGRTTFLVPGKSTLSISGRYESPYNANKLWDKIENDLQELGHLVTHMNGMHNTFEMIVYVHNGSIPIKDLLPPIVDQIDNIFRNYESSIYKNEIQFQQSRPVQTIQTPTPAPDYLFSYLPTNIICDECGGSFSYKDFKSDSIGYGDDEAWSNTLCPLCGEWNCADVIYEDVKTALTPLKTKEDFSLNEEVSLLHTPHIYFGVIKRLDKTSAKVNIPHEIYGYSVSKNYEELTHYKGK